MPRYFIDCKPNTLSDACEIIRILEMKLSDEIKLKNQMNECYELLNENINMFKHIFEMNPEGVLETLKGTPIQNQIETNTKIKIEYVDCSEGSLELQLKSIDDACLKISKLKQKIFQTDYLREIIQSLKENIIVFEEMICNLVMDTEDILSVQVENTKPDLNLDFKIVQNDNQMDKQSKLIDFEKNLVECSTSQLTINNNVNHILNINNTDPLKVKLDRTSSELKNSIDTNIRQSELSKIKSRKKTFACNICNDKFSSIYKTKKHRMKCHTVLEAMHPTKHDILENMKIRINAAQKYNNLYICDICQKTFFEFEKLRGHILSTHRKIRNCKMCSKKFATDSHLRRHEKLHISKELRGTEYYCDICSQKFFTKSGLTYHMMKHNQDQPHRCNNCNKSFSRNAYLTYHMMTRHGFGRPFKCSKCERSFLIASQLKRHMEQSHDKKIIKHVKKVEGNLFKCNYCNRSYVILSALNRHIEQFHNENLSEFDNENRKCICEICGMRFTTSFTLNQHKHSHSTELYTCEICSQQFSRKHYLNIHFRKHHAGDKLFECNTCHKKYVDIYRLETHKCSDPATKSQRTFVCEICNKNFTLASNLYRHTLMHRNIKPHKCQICSRDFSQKHTLNFHLQVHAGLKPYAKMKNK